MVQSKHAKAVDKALKAKKKYVKGKTKINRSDKDRRKRV